MLQAGIFCEQKRKEGARPLRPRKFGWFPRIGSPFAGEAREKASSLCGEVTSAAKSEGLSPYTITALTKNLPYFFKKLLHRLDFRRLFCYNS